MSYQVEVVKAESWRPVNNQTGERLNFHKQEVLWWMPGDQYPRHCNLTLPNSRDGKPYAVGYYNFVSDPSLDQFNNVRPSLALEIVD